MRVLKEGDPDRLDPAYKIECRKCGCLFECRRSETETGYDQREGGSWCKVSCPSCKTPLFYYPKKGGL